MLSSSSSEGLEKWAVANAMTDQIATCQKPSSAEKKAA